MPKLNYSNYKIIIKNFPPRIEDGEGSCCRTYLYEFKNPLPDRSGLAFLGDSLYKKFIYPKETYELLEDGEVELFVTISKLSKYSANIALKTTMPEECAVFLHRFTLSHVCLKKNLER